MANPVAGAANAAKKAFSLKNIFTLGVVGTIATAGGMILGPIAAACAGEAAAAAGATHATVLGSLHSTLVTSTAGEVGLTAGIPKMAAGVVAWFKSAFTVASAGLGAIPAGGMSPLEAMQEALFSPI
jgi:hypothetical protein